MTLFTHDMRALRLLAGCPDGATLDALAQHGFDRDCLEALVTLGFTRSERQHFAAGFIVTRFRLTAAGREIAS